MPMFVLDYCSLKMEAGLYFFNWIEASTGSWNTQTHAAVNPLLPLTHVLLQLDLWLREPRL